MGGGGVVHGNALEAHGPVAAQWEALELAADALAAGEPVPLSVTARFGESWLPATAYRAMGHVGWLTQAWQHGSLLKLWSHPFQD
jgi:hypothetical protein